MKAMIMAAGVGSRLMPLTAEIPKPMVPMGNMPLMENSVRLLAGHQCKDIIANLFYQAEMISDYFGDGSLLGVNMNYSREKELMGTAGGVRKCDWFLNETFIVLSGDALTDIDLSKLYRQHKSSGALASIALKRVADVEQFGIVICDENARIRSFQEKPRQDEALSNNANTGIYIFEPEIFKYIPPAQFYDFGKQVFPHLVKIGAPFYGFEIDSYWCDVGSISAYRQAHADILNGQVSYQPKGKIITAAGQSLLIGNGVQIGQGVQIEGNVVIGENSYIADGVRLSNTVIWNGACIGEGSFLTDTVVGAGCTIGKQVKVEPGAVLASRCTVDDYRVIPAQSKIFPSPAENQLEMA